MGNNANVLLIDLSKIFFELTVHLLFYNWRLLHYLDKSLLVSQEVRMNVNKLLFLGLNQLPQNIILPLAVNSCAFISRA